MQLKGFGIGNALKRLLLLFVIGLFSTFLITSQTPIQAQSPRGPVYVVAHRCNKTSWPVDAAKNHKVNAIEGDFIFSASKSDWYLGHDTLVTPLDTWLDSLAQEASTPNTSLALLYVDIKTPDAPLDALYDRIRAKLPTLELVFDIGLVKSGSYLAKIKNRILNDPKAVAAMGFDDSPTDVNDFFKKEGYPLNKYWYEIGLAAGFVWSAKEEKWAQEAINARNAGTGPKVAIWTFEKKSVVKDWLEKGVDAILVNSSYCFGRTTAFATDADEHVRTAQNLPGVQYAKPSGVRRVSVTTKDYEVSVKTGNKTGAGTDSNIFITIFGGNGNTIETRLNGLISGNAFERNQTDKVTLKGLADVGELRRVKMRSDNKFAASAWYLESVTVNGRTANFNTWLETGKLEAVASF
jgi:hypothetical protein